MTAAAMRRGAFGLFVALIAFGSPVLAQNDVTSGAAKTAALREIAQAGRRAFAQGDYPTALRLLHEAAAAVPPDASSDDADALLGYMYGQGVGVPQNYPQAVEFDLQAAASGNLVASFNLGINYDHLKDYAKAVAAYRVAAEKGYARAQAYLAEHLRIGSGVVRDESKMVEWDRKSAEQNDAVGEYGLARAYDFGQGGLTVDVPQAAHWYRLAAEQGYARAQADLALLYTQGRPGVPIDYTEAAHWFRLAAEQDVPGALSSYGYSLDKGYGVSKDPVAALVWYRRAAQYGQPNAMQSLAGHYLRGIGVAADLSEGLYWALLAQHFYAPGVKRDQVTSLLVPIETQIGGDAVKAVKDRVAAFTPKTPPNIDIPVAQMPVAAIAEDSIRDRMRRDAHFQLYTAWFAATLDSDGQVLALNLLRVTDPAAGTGEAIEATPTPGFIDAVRDRLGKKRPLGVPAGKASFNLFYFYSPAYPELVITNLDKGTDDQP